MTAFPAPPIPTAPILTDDRPCIRCGYSLVGMRANGICPECGTPVERSLLGDLLVYSDEQYVQTVRRGAGLIMALFC